MFQQLLGILVGDLGIQLCEPLLPDIPVHKCIPKCTRGYQVLNGPNATEDMDEFSLSADQPEVP